MKFLEKLDFFKPLGKGLAEADTFMRREMPFNMSWGAPAAAAAAYFGGPVLLNAIGGSTGGLGSILGSSGSGSMTAGNSMLANYGLDAGKNFVASNGANFALPSSAYTESIRLFNSRESQAKDIPFMKRVICEPVSMLIPENCPDSS